MKVGRLYGRAKRRPVNLTAKQSSELNSVGPETPKSMNFFWFGPLPVMTSSPLIRLQRPLPPSSGTISKNENKTLSTVFYKLSENIFFDFRLKNFFISGLTKSLITSGKVEFRRQIFDMFLRMFQTICRPIFSDFEPQIRFSTLVTHIRGSMSHMSHSDVIYLTDRK